MSQTLKGAMATTAAKSEQPKDVKSLLASPEMLTQIQHALPKHMKADRMARVMLTEMRKNPKLAACEPYSFMGAVMQLSQLGLEPGGALGHAYLIPFNRNVKVGNGWKKVPEVQLIVGYRGMLDLARRSGQIVSITARVIYAKDSYTIGFGLKPTLEHVPAWHEADRGEPLFFYAVAELKDGGVQFEVMSVAEVNAIRDKSLGYITAKTKSTENGKPIDHPWASNYDEMGKKTVTRRLFKWLPVSIEIQRAVGLDEMVDANLSQHNALVLEGDFHIDHDDDVPEIGNDPVDAPLTTARLVDLLNGASDQAGLDAAWEIGQSNGLTDDPAITKLYGDRLKSIKK